MKVLLMYGDFIVDEIERTIELKNVKGYCMVECSQADSEGEKFLQKGHSSYFIPALSDLKIIPPCANICTRIKKLQALIRIEANKGSSYIPQSIDSLISKLDFCSYDVLNEQFQHAEERLIEFRDSFDFSFMPDRIRLQWSILFWICAISNNLAGSYLLQSEINKAIKNTICNFFYTDHME